MASSYMAICHVSRGQLAWCHASICFLALGYLALSCGQLVTAKLVSWVQLEVSSSTLELLRRRSALWRIRYVPGASSIRPPLWLALIGQRDTHRACPATALTAGTVLIFNIITNEVD